MGAILHHDLFRATRTMGLTLLSLTGTPSLQSVRSTGTAQPGTGGLEVVMGGGFCRSSEGRQELQEAGGGTVL